MLTVKMQAGVSRTTAAVRPPFLSCFLLFFCCAFLTYFVGYNFQAFFCSSDCGSEVVLRPGDIVICRECGYRILYKKRTKQSKCTPISPIPVLGLSTPQQLVFRRTKAQHSLLLFTLQLFNSRLGKLSRTWYEPA